MFSGACDRNRSEVLAINVNVQVVGTPECLGEVTTKLSENGIKMAHVPIWTGKTGRIEFGPVPLVNFDQVSEAIQNQACVVSVKQRPCSTPLTDVNFCGL
jgi:hypothetical protein